jgi:hypothetical protein
MTDGFQTIALDALPKRTPRGFDAAKAAALLTAVQAQPDAGATDGVAYATEAEARILASRFKRLLANVAPKGTVAKSRVFPIKDDAGNVTGYGWAVLLGAPAAKAPAAKSAK